MDYKENWSACLYVISFEDEYLVKLVHTNYSKIYVIFVKSLLHCYELQTMEIHIFSKIFQLKYILKYILCSSPHKKIMYIKFKTFVLFLFNLYRNQLSRATKE